MAWVESHLNGGGGSSIIEKTYIKFNGTGLILPWTVNSDYKIVCVFHDTTYKNDSCITGSTGGWRYDPCIQQYGNRYEAGTANGGVCVSLGSWSVGEHTYINNNGNNQNELDGVTGEYVPNTSAYYYTIGCRGDAHSLTYENYIKSFKIYSLSTGDLLHDLHPCAVYNLAAFMDVADNNTLYTCSGLQAYDAIPQS